MVTISGPAGFTGADLVGGQTSVTTGTDGFYQFLLVPGAPVGSYTLSVAAPGGYVNAPSTLIPVCTTPAFGAAPFPDPTLIQSTSLAPTGAIHDPTTCPANAGALNAGNQATTQYYFTFNINPATAADILNNHIPLDPIGATDIVVTKTTPIVNTHIGQLVPYTITVRNTSSLVFTNIDIRDVIPAGFKYKVGSASRDGVKAEPVISGRNLTWGGQTLTAGVTQTYKLILVVGSGVQPGEYTNTAQALGNPGSVPVSNLASATVRIIPDPVFDCSDIIGKVFDDKNANGYHDEGEVGVPNVRLATVNGLLVTTDEYGRFHVACAAISDADRGSNFLMKLDERTLPSGYRLTTENPRDVRVTRGKMTKLNFGVSIHRVVRIDIQDSAFVSNSVDLNEEWVKQLEQLPETLKSAPSVVRVSYTSAEKDNHLARKRMKAIVSIIENEWKDKDCCHEIQIEEELIMKSVTKSGGAK